MFCFIIHCRQVRTFSWESLKTEMRPSMLQFVMIIFTANLGYFYLFHPQKHDILDTLYNHLRTIGFEDSLRPLSYRHKYPLLITRVKWCHVLGHV